VTQANDLSQLTVTIYKGVLFNLYLGEFKGGITPSIKFYQNLK